MPVAHIVTNQAPPTVGKDGAAVPSLMSFSECRTLFHETGHALQHVLTQVDEGHVSGIAGVECAAARARVTPPLLRPLRRARPRLHLSSVARLPRVRAVACRLCCRRRIGGSVAPHFELWPPPLPRPRPRPRSPPICGSGCATAGGTRWSSHRSGWRTGSSSRPCSGRWRCTGRPASRSPTRSCARSRRPTRSARRPRWSVSSSWHSPTLSSTAASSPATRATGARSGMWSARSRRRRASCRPSRRTASSAPSATSGQAVTLPVTTRAPLRLAPRSRAPASARCARPPRRAPRATRHVSCPARSLTCPRHMAWLRRPLRARQVQVGGGALSRRLRRVRGGRPRRRRGGACTRPQVRADGAGHGRKPTGVRGLPGVPRARAAGGRVAPAQRLAAIWQAASDNSYGGVGLSRDSSVQTETAGIDLDWQRLPLAARRKSAGQLVHSSVILIF